MDYSALTHIPLFGQITPDELEGIFNELNIHENSFKKGEILALQDEPANRLIILLKGSVKAEMTDPSGKVVKVEDIEAPNPLAVLFLFGRDNRFPVQATAREHVEAVVIPKQSILKMLSMNETILKNYLDISADFASRLSRKLHFMSFRAIRQKTAMYLLHLATVSGTETVELDKTKAALAEYFGVSRPSLEREMTRMQQEGLIVAERRRITISDKRKLAQLLHCIFTLVLINLNT